VFTITADRDNRLRRLLLPVKANLSPTTTGGLAYTIENLDGTPRVVWEQGQIIQDVDDAVEAEAPEDRRGRREAQEWLKDQLAEGPQPRNYLLERGKAMGFSERTICRAAAALNINYKVERGHWALPSNGDHDRPNLFNDTKS
jgi:hypothetical protein